MKKQKPLRTAALRPVTLTLLLLLSGCRGCRHRPGSASLGYVPRQGKLEQPLIDYMTKVPAGTPISIVVTLHTNVTEADKRSIFQRITATNQLDRMEQRRKIMTEELKRV